MKIEKQCFFSGVNYRYAKVINLKIDSIHSKVCGSNHYVQIVTDSGVVGHGQSGCWAYPQAVHEVVNVFAKYLVGQDPRKIEHHWHHLYRMGPFRGSILTSGVSAIDIALWDIAGKRLGVPIYELLGGPTRTKLRLHLLLRSGSIEELVADARSAIAEGFTALKFDPLPENVQSLSLPEIVSKTVACAKAIRDTVGESVDLIFELHRKLTALQSSAIMNELAVFRPLFIEDPIQIDSFSAQSRVASTHDGAVGVGERLHNIWEFNDILTLGGPQYVRPDLGTAGGISQVKKIASLAEAHSSTLVVHNCLGPIITAASAHIGASIPNFIVQEFSRFDDSLALGSGIQSHFKRDGGWLLLSNEPGLGVDVDWERLPVIDFVGREINDIPYRDDGSVSFAV